MNLEYYSSFEDNPFRRLAGGIRNFFRNLRLCNFKNHDPNNDGRFPIRFHRDPNNLHPMYYRDDNPIRRIINAIKRVFNLPY